MSEGLASLRTSTEQLKRWMLVSGIGTIILATFDVLGSILG
jgi:hypothetical protein